MVNISLFDWLSSWLSLWFDLRARASCKNSTSLFHLWSSYVCVKQEDLWFNSDELDWCVAWASSTIVVFLYSSLAYQGKANTNAAKYSNAFLLLTRQDHPILSHLHHALPRCAVLAVALNGQIIVSVVLNVCQDFSFWQFADIYLPPTIDNGNNWGTSNAVLVLR